MLHAIHFFEYRFLSCREEMIVGVISHTLNKEAFLQLMKKYFLHLKKQGDEVVWESYTSIFHYVVSTNVWKKHLSSYELQAEVPS